jgi:hypothetical protein
VRSLRINCLDSVNKTVEEKRIIIGDALDHHDTEAELSIEHDLEENSPYPEVVAAVRNTDEDVPANTVRGMSYPVHFCFLERH